MIPGDGADDAASGGEAGGSSVDAGADDPLSRDDVAEMVAAIEPSWTLRAARPAPEGTDAVYFVEADTPTGRREAVLKACAFVEPAEFRPEPFVLAVLDRRTSIPVPSVIGVVDDRGDRSPLDRDLPTPFFLMERCEGEVREGGARGLDPAVVERIARNAGRHLADVHGIGAFDRFGPVRLEEGAAFDRPDPDRLFVPDGEGHETRRSQFEAALEWNLERLHERFVDLESDLRAFARERLDALDGSVEPVFGNDDYRLGNLLLDPDTGEPNAVLDWGNLRTTDPCADLVAAEENLSGRGSLEDPLRERVRGALLEGYEEASGSRVAVPEPRRELYLATSRIAALVWFSLWYGDESAAERDRIARRHRSVVRDLLRSG